MRHILAHLADGRFGLRKPGTAAAIRLPTAALGICALCVSLAAAAEETPERPLVPGFERYADDASRNADRGGMLLVSELNCTSCHESAVPVSPVGPKPAPNLTDVGSRVRPQYIRDLLTDPQRCKPGTTMPDLLHGLPESQRNDRIDALVHFLASTGRLSEAAPSSGAARRGDVLYHSLGCVACHASRREPSVAMPHSVPLVDLSRKYSVPSLAKFLENPLIVRPGGRMPHFNLAPEEAKEIASFLLNDLEVPTSLTFKYYEGGWEKLPDFAQLPVKDQGAASGFDVDVGNKDHFGIRFEGTIRIEREGDYRFHLGSDDGARLVVDGATVVDNDGIHGVVYKSGSRKLSAGLHAIVVDYFEQAGGQELYLDIEGPEMDRQPLDRLLTTRDPRPEKPLFQADPQRAAQGREYFVTSGCANCHELRLGDSRLAASPPAGKFADLRVARGCLAEQPPPAVPDYSLSDAQRSAIAGAITGLRRGNVFWNDPADRISQTLWTMNCYACHVRGEIGGVEAARNEFFLTTQPEMGDEGRIPPHLTLVGAKLKPDWLKHIFQNGAKDRPYMQARMPRFGEANLGDIVADLVEADGAAGQFEPPMSLDRKVKSVGRQLVGDKGLSCIKCHTWGNSKATGIQAISLTSMTRRLRHDYFLDYLLNPQQFRPGTRMPAAWPGGQSPFPNILDGNARLQIESLWAYLEDGTSAHPPIGLISNPIELVPDARPVIYRNFLDAVGPRAIGVGYPERVNLAYDAENCRLAMLWQGAFLDASMHWVGRGDGFQKPLGDNVLKLPGGVPLAKLKSLDDPWPTQAAGESGFHFQGYRLDVRGRPTFLYRWHESEIVEVQDQMDPVAVGEGSSTQRILRRSLRVSRAPRDAFLRVAVAASIQNEGSRRFLVDNDWQIRVEHFSAEPMVRAVQSMQELLIPLPTDPAPAGAATIVLEYHW